MNGVKLSVGSEWEVELTDEWGGCGDDGLCQWTVGEGTIPPTFNGRLSTRPGESC